MAIPFPISITFVNTFLDQSKDDAKRLIRHEMESMLDPLVESLFKQLKDKFVDYVGLDSSSLNQESELQHHEHDLDAYRQMIRDKQNTNAQQYQCQSLDNSIDANCQLNSNNNHEPPLIFNNEDYDDGVQWIDDEQNDEQSSRPFKRQRMNKTQPNNSQSVVTRQSETQPNNETQQPNEAELNEVTNQDSQTLITLALECTELNCTETFVQNEHSNLFDQLKDHMWNVHSIRRLQCPVKDCRQSFDNKNYQRVHIKEAHSHTTQWQCHKCPKHFTKYQLLSSHNTKLHQLGQFQCAFPQCTFTGEYRKKVFNHYEYQHKNKPDLKCPQTDCQYRTKDSAQFKAHKRTHHGIEPYRCQWPNCNYSSVTRKTTMAHIKRIHLSSKAGQDLSHLGKPSDYLELVA